MTRNAALILLALWSLGCATAAPETPASPDKCRRHENYAMAMNAYDSGTAALARKEFKTASALLGQGLDVLGTGYYDDEILDDTGMNLAIAQVNANKGRFEIAAHIRERSLDSRLKAFRAKTGCDRN